MAALGALLLLVSLFLDWYGDAGGDDGITAWNSFELVDLLLAALAVVAIYAAFEALAPTRWPRLHGVAARAAGPIALLLVFVAIVNKPPVLLFVPGAELEIGVWLALAGALLMTVGALLGRVRVSFVVSPRDDATAAPGAGDPARPHDQAAETRVMQSGSQPPGI